MNRHITMRCITLAAAIVACGGGGGDSNPTGPGDNTVVITLTGSSTFSPSDVTIDPGTTVRWTNATSLMHTVTPDNAQQAGVWVRAVTTTTGTVLTHTFNVSGQTYMYHCEPHLSIGMTGVIRVR